MEPMAYAEPGGIASADEYNKVVDNVNEIGRGTLCRRYADVSQPDVLDRTWTKVRFPGSRAATPHVQVNAAADTFTIATTGSYRISGSVRFDNNSTGSRHIVLGNNTSPGAGGARWIGSSVPSAADNYTVSAGTDLNFVAGDEIAVWVYQSSGAARTLTASSEATNITIRYCGES